MISDFENNVREASEYIAKEIGTDNCDVGVIIGTGVKAFAGALKGKTIDYLDIPAFPKSNVKSNGSLIHTQIADKNILFFNGRIHYYEGFPIDEVAFPVRVMKELNVTKMIIINSAATLSTRFSPGDIMIIEDHINCTGVNPLIGKTFNEHGSKFVDMSEPYSRSIIQLLDQTSHIPLNKGIYIGVTGPNFETPAEVRYYRMIGGDVIGMSTVGEVIVAAQCSIETAALSCVTNYAAGVSAQRLTKEESIALSKKAEEELVSIILNLLAVL